MSSPATPASTSEIDASAAAAGTSAASEPIAIVGMALRFPGDNVTAGHFAEFLRNGGNGVTDVPPQRWPARTAECGREGASERLATGGGFLRDIDQFDAAFFNVSPKEARFLDPQQRIVLETAWEALEYAGIDPSRVPGGEGGIYIGCSLVDYLFQVAELSDDQLDAHLNTGTAPSAIPGRLSHFLGWHGPSMTVDTACASSLVAMHLAAEALRTESCSVALAGGVNLIHHPRNHVIFSAAGMLAPDGRCKTFDESADGYGRSEGCGILVLKRLADAQQDGDQVLALLSGSSIRQDGASGGMTVPNGLAQADVMRAALRAADLDPGDIGYVEAHGTGTPLGDPIEMAAINSVFGRPRPVGESVVVGSVKTNIGHMEAAAGIGGVIKSILQLRDEAIYPHIGFTKPSPHIPWSRYKVSIPTSVQPWPREPRRAVVNAFGFAGTIASAVIEQAPPETTPVRRDGAEEHLLTISAKSATALKRRVGEINSLLTTAPETRLEDLCYTSNARRAHFDHRFACTASKASGFVRELNAWAVDGGAPRTPLSGGDPVAFLFSAQGGQSPGMGRALYGGYTVFRDCVDECDELFRPLLRASVKDLLLVDADDAGGLRVHQTSLAQPALFVLEYSLARLWISWGVRPRVLLGHSFGELVAATIAGLFSLEDAVLIAAARGRVTEAVTTAGGMAVVGAAREDVAPHLEGVRDIGIAAINGPTQCVISGGKESLEAVIRSLGTAGIDTKLLAIPRAFHSPLMSEAATELEDSIADVVFREPTTPFISSLTGQIARYEDVGSARYWAKHLTETVDFVAGVRSVEAHGSHVFIEMGPSAALLGMGRQSAQQTGHTWIASITGDAGDGADTRRALARCYTAGVEIDWPAFHRDFPGAITELPKYRFERKRYWLPPARSGSVGAATSALPLVGTETSNETADVREFRAYLSEQEPAWLADHVLEGRSIFPVAAYVELCLAAQDAIFGTADRPVEHLRVHEPLLLSDEPTEVLTRVRSHTDATATVDILSRQSSAKGTFERQHATATLGNRRAKDPGLGALVGELQRLADADSESNDAVAGDDFYAELAAIGFTYGPSFARVLEVQRRGADIVVGRHQPTSTTAGTQLPPFALDAAFQTLLALTEPGSAFAPMSLAEVELYKKPKGPLRSIVRLTGDGDDLSVDVVILEGREPVAAVRGARLARIAVRTEGKREAPGLRADLDRPIDLGSLLALVPHERRRAVIDIVRKEVATALSFDRPEDVPLDATFLELGVNSMLSVIFKNTLEAELAMPLSASVVFDYPSVRKLGEHISDRLAPGEGPEPRKPQTQNANL